MKIRTKVMKAGNGNTLMVTIPRTVREVFEIEPGDMVEWGLRLAGPKPVLTVSVIQGVGGVADHRDAGTDTGSTPLVKRTLRHG